MRLHNHLHILATAVTACIRSGSSASQRAHRSGAAPSGAARRARRAGGVAVLVCAAVLATAPVSGAQLVVERGDAIYGMNDNGSNQRQLIAESQVPGVAEPAHLYDTDVFQNGGQAVVFDKAGSLSSSSCGLYCEAIYTLSGGSLTRLSPASSPFGGTWVSFDRQPRVTADSQVAYQSSLWDLDTFPISNSTELGTYPLSGGGASQGWASQGSSVELPTPNPADATQLAWVSFLNNQWELHANDRSDSSDALVAYSDAQNEPTSVSWSPDGSRLVVGFANEILELNPSNGTEIRLYLYTGSSGGPSSVRFVGNSAVVFVQNGDVYTIPTTCNDCTVSNATQLTSDGDSYSVAWTSATTPIPALGQTPGTGSGSGSGSGTGSGSAGSGPSTGSGSGASHTGTIHCTVPKLAGLTLAAAKRALAHAHCRAGKVSRRRSRHARHGRVISSSPVQGATKPSGARVALVLAR